jgi:hypothetical protein
VIGLMTAPLEDRVRQLENDLSLTLLAARALQSPPKKSFLVRLFEMTQSIIVALLPAIIVALLPIWVTYRLVESVKQAIEERQLQTTNATEMKALLLGNNTTKSGTDEAHANARALGAFGRFAVPPMIELLDEGSVAQMESVQQGLFTAGLTDLNGTCTILIRVLKNRTRRYKWLTHKSIGGLLADLNCPEAASALLSYQNLLNLGSEHYSKVVVPPESPDKFNSLKIAIGEDLSRLNEGD